MSDVIVVGSFIQDLAFRTPQFPATGETRIGTFRMGPGGKGFNQAIACSRLGISTSFIGAYGKDAFATDLQLFLRQEKLKTYFDTIPSQATGVASILVNELGQNQILVALGANDFLSSEYINAQSAVFSKAKILVCQCESNLAATRTALDLSKKAGAKIILNPAPINVQLTRELTDSVDILVPNETEAAFLLEHLCGISSKKLIVDCSDEELSQIARKISPATVIITLGKAGAFVAPVEAPSYRIPAISVNAIDTTGAGDAFTGGLAAGLIKFPGTLEKAVRYATVVAGLSTEKEGTAPAMPDEVTVQSIFSKM